MLYKVEGFTHVHHATKDFTIMSKKIVNSFNYRPGTHRSGTARLVGKLQLVNTKNIPVKDKDDPIQELQNETTDRYASIIRAGVDTS